MALKQWDSGIHDQQVEKAVEAVSFNGTFNSAPDVFVTCYSTGAPAKGTGTGNVTTTGFDIYSEETGDTGWVARETGFDNASSSSSSVSSSSSSLSSSSSSSSLSSSSSSSSLSSSSSSSSLSSSSLSSSSSSSSLSSSSSSSSSSLSSSSSSSSTSSSSSSCEPGTVVYGHHTAVSEDYDEDFNLNWTTGNGWAVSGSGDTETIYTSAGCTGTEQTISDPWCLGAITAVIKIDKYLSGSGPTPIIHYKTAALRTGLPGATWTLYDGVSFVSLGWIQLRLTHSYI